MRQDAFVIVKNGEVEDVFLKTDRETIAQYHMKPVIILDRETVELVIQALEVAWANDDDGIYEHALKAVRGD